MGTISLQIPQIGQPCSTEDPKVQGDLIAIQTAINGQIDATNLSAGTAQSAGVNQSTQTVKGASIVSTSQSTGSTTFTTLATPDQVTGIVLPSPGLIVVLYQATWQESVFNGASAAIFFGASQVQIANAGAPAGQSAGIGGTAKNTPLCTRGDGLVSVIPTSGYTGDVTTGQIVGTGSNFGGPCYIFAAAGTYTVSVQFKASSGTVTASNRRLYVQAVSFA